MNSQQILLIDDEPGVLRALTLLLQAIGYRVKNFNNPSEAVDYLRGVPDINLDLILCDLRMPEMSGFDVLQKTQELCSHIPFILISGHATNDEIQKAHNMGANGFLGKPFTPEQLRELLGKYAALGNDAQNQ